MKFGIYQGPDNQKIPDHATHVIVHNGVTVIKKHAFLQCKRLVCVIMGDNVKRIERWAFGRCYALRSNRFSKTLEFIGECVFSGCYSLEALFL